MVIKFMETFSTSILLILLAVYILHLIRGDATNWLFSKFTVYDPAAKSTTTTSTTGTSSGSPSTGGVVSGGGLVA